MVIFFGVVARNWLTRGAQLKATKGALQSLSTRPCTAQLWTADPTNHHGMATNGWPGYRLAIQQVDGENLLGGLVQPVQRLNTGAGLQISAIM
jgi:hypothetical protein